MGLLETLVLGSYLFTAWVYRQVRRLAGNHMKHLEGRLQRVEKTLNLGEGDEASHSS